MKGLKERLAEQEAKQGDTQKQRPAPRPVTPAIPTVDVGIHGANMGVLKKQPFREFDVARTRPWKYHNRNPAWLKRPEQRSLQDSIQRHGQLELGLVRTVEGVPGVDAEIVYGYRRSEACRSLNKKFRARVLPNDTTDTECMALMHVENKESQDVSELEDARVYQRLLQDGVYANQTEIANSLNVSQVYVSRLLSTTPIFDYDWLLAVIEPVIVDVSVRTASTLAASLKDPQTQRAMRNAARRISDSGQIIAANQLINELIGSTGGKRKAKNEKLVLRKKGRSNVAVLTHDGSGNLNLSVLAHEQTPEEREALIERIAAALRDHL